MPQPYSPADVRLDEVVPFEDSADEHLAAAHSAARDLGLNDAARMAVTIAHAVEALVWQLRANRQAAQDSAESCDAGLANIEAAIGI